jgi:hypothetical protein
MAQIEQFKTASDFWSKMVVPDYEEYCEKSADLRAALHAAISLFHMADWVFHAHEGAVKAAFTFSDKNGAVQPVSCAEHFATSLEQRCDDFGRIRGIANATKHLRLNPSGIRPVRNAPRNAANTLVQTTGFGEGGYGQGPYGGGPRVMLEGSPDMEFSEIAKAVFDMWKSLKLAYGW